MSDIFFTLLISGFILCPVAVRLDKLMARHYYSKRGKKEMMKLEKGNLITKALKGQFDVIVHGCNCFNKMGAGIALEMKRIFPEAYYEDCKTMKGNKLKLGKISYVEVERNDIKFTIVNAYIQYHYGGYKPNVDYHAVRSCMKLIKNKFSGKRIGFPMIGAGLAGGEWGKISKIIEEELINENITIVFFER